MRILRLLLLSMILFAAANPARVSAQSVSEAEQAELAGPWRGNWTAPEGWLYEAVMTLRVAASGAVTGEINWTIRKSARPAEQAKLGMSGVELVRGNYYANPATLILEGYDKKDPNSVIGLDKYRLVVSPNRRTMGGITGHRDAWNAQFFLSR